MSRICIVCPSLEIGGAEIWTVSLANLLDATICVPSYQFDPRLEARANKKALGYRETAKALKECDIVISWGVDDPDLFPAKNHVQVIHGEGRQARKSIYELKHLKPSYVAVSPAVAHMGLLYGNVTVISNGIDEDRCKAYDNARIIERQKLSLCDEEIAVGFVGNFKQFKGVLDPVRAAVADSSHRIVPILVGNDVSKDVSIMACATFSRTRVRFPRLDVGNIMAAIDCFMLTSYSEAFSLALAEAWYCGVPTVVTNVGAVPFIEKMFGEITTKVPYMASGDELAQAVRHAVEKRSYVEKARSIVKNHFTANIMAERWKSYLRQEFTLKL